MIHGPCGAQHCSFVIKQSEQDWRGYKTSVRGLQKGVGNYLLRDHQLPRSRRGLAGVRPHFI